MKKLQDIIKDSLTEAKLDPKKLKKGKQVRIMRGPDKGQLAKIVDWDHPDEDNEGYQIHVKKKSGKIGYLDQEDLAYA